MAQTQHEAHLLIDASRPEYKLETTASTYSKPLRNNSKICKNYGTGILYIEVYTIKINK